MSLDILLSVVSSYWWASLIFPLAIVFIYFALTGAGKTNAFMKNRESNDELGVEMIKSTGALGNEYSAFLFLVSLLSLIIYNHLHGQTGEPYEAVDGLSMITIVLGLGFSWIGIFFLLSRLGHFSRLKMNMAIFNLPVPMGRFLVAMVAGLIWIGISNGLYDSNQLGYAVSCLTGILFPTMLFRVAVRTWIFKGYTA